MIKGCLTYPTLTGCHNEQGRPLPAGGAVAAYQVHPVGVHHPRGGVAARRCRHTLYVNLHKFVLVAAGHVQPRVQRQAGGEAAQQDKQGEGHRSHGGMEQE